MLAKLEKLHSSLPETVPTMPVSVLAGEALELAQMVARHWAAEGELPGLGSLVEVDMLPDDIADELVELALGLAFANARFRAAFEEPVAPVARGLALLSELKQSLQFLFASDADDSRVSGVERAADAYGSKSSSHDALALALVGLAGHANEHRAELCRLPAFDPATIDEAYRVAQRLSEQSAIKVSRIAFAERDRFSKLRNQLYGLLKERVGLVRSAARFVFRFQPERLELFYSAYERRKRARRAGGQRLLTTDKTYDKADEE
jgi:hypothetical protein